MDPLAFAGLRQPRCSLYLRSQLDQCVGLRSRVTPCLPQLKLLNEPSRRALRMSTCQHSSILLIIICHGQTGEVLSLLRVLAQLKTKVSLLGVLPQCSHTLVLDRGGIASGGSYRFWDFLHDSYILRIAHVKARVRQYFPICLVSSSIQSPVKRG